MRRYNFGQTRVSRKAPVPRPSVGATGVFRQSLGENKPQYIRSALYSSKHISVFLVLYHRSVCIFVMFQPYSPTVRGSYRTIALGPIRIRYERYEPNRSVPKHRKEQVLTACITHRIYCNIGTGGRNHACFSRNTLCTGSPHTSWIMIPKFGVKMSVCGCWRVVIGNILQFLL